ncbi:MAG: hypothetical protein WCY77_07410 [Weeksellaceae bacterium]
MKNRITIFLFLVLSTFLWAQEKSYGNKYNLNCKVTTVVFPGCETIDIHNNLELNKCMQVNLNELLAYHLLEFQEKMETGKVALKLQFTVDENGKIVEIKTTENTNSEFNQAVELAMQKIADLIGYIEPAKNAGDEKVKHVFTLPVQIEMEEKGKCEIE